MIPLWQDAYEKLTPDLKEEWDSIFGRSTRDQSAGEKKKDETPAKKPFGFGATIGSIYDGGGPR